jgi:hypothetical protein
MGGLFLEKKSSINLLEHTNQTQMQQLFLLFILIIFLNLTKSKDWKKHLFTLE